MFKVSEENNSISFAMSSENSFVDRISQLCREFLAENGVSHFSNFNITLRELLVNAIEHGNRNDINKTVQCAIVLLDNKRLQLTIEDEGDGFDFDSLDLSLPDDPEQVRNRGLALANAFSDQLDFQKGGSKVTAFISPFLETTFSVTEEEGVQVILASGNITASSAPQLRETLVRLLDDGKSQFRFDMANVEDLDSVSLSVFVVFASTLKRKSSDFVLELTNPNSDLQNLFHLTRLDKLFKIAS